MLDDQHVELEREVDGRWIAEVPAIPGALVYGTSGEQAFDALRRLAADVLNDRQRHGEPALRINSAAGLLKMKVGRHVAAVVHRHIDGMLIGYVDGLPGHIHRLGRWTSCT